MKKLVAYITSTYPEKNFSMDLALSLAQHGVDSIELGIPFSDPVADGPIIEKANHKALQNGFKFADILDISKAISNDIDTLWMGYFNLFFQHGMKDMIQKAKELNVSALIIPDMPYEEESEYDKYFKEFGVSNITFVAPTDPKERIKKIATDASKFIYMVAYAGITGSGKSEDLQSVISDIREVTSTPIYVGFGVNEKSAKDKVKGADGVIVGSALVDVLLQDHLTYDQMIKRCCEISKNIKDSINQ